jgi:hypothetical protein
VTTTTVPAATTTSLPADCARPGVVATVLPAGFDKVMLPGLGLTGIASAECAYHWAGPNAVVAVLPTGYSPLGPPAEAQQTVRRGGRTMYVGRTPQGATGLVIEDRELGGAPDIWFTLLSNTVSAEDLINIAAGLQRG